MRMSILFYKRMTLVRVVFFALLVTSSITAETNPEQWGVAISGTGERGDAPLRLQLTMVEGDPLIGGVSADTLSPDIAKIVSPFVIEGHRRKDGTFWPEVELQIQTKPDGAWRKIATSLDDGVPANVMIFTGMLVDGLRIDLEPFRSHLAKGELGRVLFKSGDAVTVDFKYLIDPSKEPDRSTKSD